MLSKTELRQEVKANILKMSKTRRQELDAMLCRRFFSLLNRLQTINNQTPLNLLSYMPLADEPDISELTARSENINLILPVSLPDGTLELKAAGKLHTRGLFGIIEPAADAAIIRPEEIDLALIPGRAFTPDCWRLGRGKGYYDRLIRSLDCPKVALAYQLQLYTQIPLEPHDQQLDLIITETDIYSTGKYL